MLSARLCLEHVIQKQSAEHLTSTQSTQKSLPQHHLNTTLFMFKAKHKKSSCADIPLPHGIIKKLTIFQHEEEGHLLSSKSTAEIGQRIKLRNWKTSLLMDSAIGTTITPTYNVYTYCRCKTRVNFLSMRLCQHTVTQEPNVKQEKNSLNVVIFSHNCQDIFNIE